ncbi:unnamed protein product [Meloidogyne enterolobii]|uniref:Uncharacterized protein n=1 Tax=Meloidogyne enterolobii TaxID=390850 RepID=A0ACB1AHA3_MELEN
MSTEFPKQSSLESSKISSDGSPPREENFIESLNSQVDKSNIEEIIKTQKRSLERFEKTNEMLGNCCILAEKRLEKAKKEFASNKEQILQAKQDLDFIFRKIFNLKKILAKEYPKEYEEEGIKRVEGGELERAVIPTAEIPKVSSRDRAGLDQGLGFSCTQSSAIF